MSGPRYRVHPRMAKPANHKENRRDRRYVRNQTGKRQCVVVIRERDGMVMPSAFKSEGAAVSYIRSHVAVGTEVMADDANSWDALHARYAVKRINHQLAYSADGACTNGAQSFFSRLRRAEVGHHHHIAGAYLARYAEESAYRKGHRRDDNGTQIRGVFGLAFKAKAEGGLLRLLAARAGLRGCRRSGRQSGGKAN